MDVKVYFGTYYSINPLITDLQTIETLTIHTLVDLQSVLSHFFISIIGHIHNDPTYIQWVFQRNLELIILSIH